MKSIIAINAEKERRWGEMGKPRLQWATHYWGSRGAAAGAAARQTPYPYVFPAEFLALLERLDAYRVHLPVEPAEAASQRIVNSRVTTLVSSATHLHWGFVWLGGMTGILSSSWGVHQPVWWRKRTARRRPVQALTNTETSPRQTTTMLDCD